MVDICGGYIALPPCLSFPWDETVWLWDLGSGQRINTYKQGCHVNTVIMHESGGSFLSSGTEGNAKAWVLGSDQPLLDDLDQGRDWISGRFQGRMSSMFMYMISH